MRRSIAAARRSRQPLARIGWLQGARRSTSLMGSVLRGDPAELVGGSSYRSALQPERELRALLCQVDTDSSTRAKRLGRPATARLGRFGPACRRPDCPETWRGRWPMDWPKLALDQPAPERSAGVDFSSKMTPRGHGHRMHWGFLGPPNDRGRGRSARVDLALPCAVAPRAPRHPWRPGDIARAMPVTPRVTRSGRPGLHRAGDSDRREVGVSGCVTTPSGEPPREVGGE